MYTEIVISSSNKETIKQDFIKKSIGEVPLCVTIFKDLLQKTPIDIIIKMVEESIRELNIDPNFPYPIYLLVSEKKISSDFMLTIHDREHLPYHFNYKTLYLETNDKSYLKKIDVLKYKIMNRDFNTIHKDIKESIKGQKKLIVLLEQIEFYQSLMDKLKENYLNGTDYIVDEYHKMREKNE